MDNQKVKKEKVQPHFYKTEEERKDAIRRSKIRYMLSKIWHCEVCDREYCLAGKTQYLKTVKNFLNRPLESDYLKPEDESIETLFNMSLKTILYNSKMGCLEYT